MQVSLDISVLGVLASMLVFFTIVATLLSLSAWQRWRRQRAALTATLEAIQNNKETRKNEVRLWLSTLDNLTEEQREEKLAELMKVEAAFYHFIIQTNFTGNVELLPGIQQKVGTLLSVYTQFGPPKAPTPETDNLVETLQAELNQLRQSNESLMKSLQQSQEEMRTLLNEYAAAFAKGTPPTPSTNTTPPAPDNDSPFAQMPDDLLDSPPEIQDTQVITETAPAQEHQKQDTHLSDPEKPADTQASLDESTDKNTENPGEQPIGTEINAEMADEIQGEIQGEIQDTHLSDSAEKPSPEAVNSRPADTATLPPDPEDSLSSATGQADSHDATITGTQNLDTDNESPAAVSDTAEAATAEESAPTPSGPVTELANDIEIASTTQDMPEDAQPGLGETFGTDDTSSSAVIKDGLREIGDDLKTLIDDDEGSPASATQEALDAISANLDGSDSGVSRRSASPPPTEASSATEHTEPVEESPANFANDIEDNAAEPDDPTRHTKQATSGKTETNDNLDRALDELLQ